MKQVLDRMRRWMPLVYIAIGLFIWLGWRPNSPAQRFDKVELELIKQARTDSLLSARIDNLSINTSSTNSLVIGLARAQCLEAEEQGDGASQRMRAAGIPCAQLLAGTFFRSP